jgi:chromosome partitioning protein
MAARVIAYAIQKGGPGKSTGVFNLAHLLASRGSKVLVVELDPQGTLRRFFGIDKPDTTTLQMLRGERYHIVTVAENLDVLPATPELAVIELEAQSNPMWGAMLREALDDVRGDYDFILLDPPPSLSILMTNTIFAADGLIIPVETEEEGYNGLLLLLNTMGETMGRIRKHWRIKDNIIAIVPTKHDRRLTHHREVLALLQQNYGPLVSMVVRDSVKYPDSTSAHIPIYQFAPDHAAPWVELAERVERWGGVDSNA